MKIFLQICFVTFIGLTCSSTVFSQILRGKVQCKEKSDIRLLPYANIVLFQEKDTTHFLKGIVFSSIINPSLSVNFLNIL